MTPEEIKIVINERNELLDLLRYFGPYEWLNKETRTRIVDIQTKWKERPCGEEFVG